MEGLKDACNLSLILFLHVKGIYRNCLKGKLI